VFNPFLSTDQSGYLYLSVTDGLGCSYTDSLEVTTNALPVVTLNPSDNAVFCVGSSVILQGSTDIGHTHQWFLNGNAIINAESSSHSASLEGVYNMIETDLNACSDSASVGVVVTKDLCVGIDDSEFARDCSL